MAGEQTISRFTEQFDWEPVVLNSDALKAYASFIVCGMGGSQLGPMHIQQFAPKPEMILHKDYGLPDMTAAMEKQSLVILSSYSGTTEETLDSGRMALAHGLPIAAVSTGGTLIDFAREHALPYVVLPDTGLQPRLAFGYSLLAIARLMADTSLEARIRESGKKLNVQVRKDEALSLARALYGKVPLIYTSRANAPIGYIWKIKMNETAKVPAFSNMFPEMCHNEINGLDPQETSSLRANMSIIMLTDALDDPRNQKRMQVAAGIFIERGISVLQVMLKGEGFAKALDAAIFADWISYALAAHYGVPDEATPLITEFKKRIAA